MNEKIKVYTIKLNGVSIWTTEDPKDFRKNLEMFKIENKMEIDIYKVIQWVKDLKISEGLSIKPISIECNEMKLEKYMNFADGTSQCKEVRIL